jgi:hypothetical protein
MPLGKFQEDLYLCESLPMRLNEWRSDHPCAAIGVEEAR